MYNAIIFVPFLKVITSSFHGNYKLTRYKPPDVPYSVSSNVQGYLPIACSVICARDGQCQGFSTVQTPPGCNLFKNIEFCKEIIARDIITGCLNFDPDKESKIDDAITQASSTTNLVHTRPRQALHRLGGAKAS